MMLLFIVRFTCAVVREEDSKLHLLEEVPHLPQVVLDTHTTDADQLQAIFQRMIQKDTLKQAIAMLNEQLETKAIDRKQ